MSRKRLPLKEFLLGFPSKQFFVFVFVLESHGYDLSIEVGSKGFWWIKFYLSLSYQCTYIVFMGFKPFSIMGEFCCCRCFVFEGTVVRFRQPVGYVMFCDYPTVVLK